jgi:hypothetical protein
MIHDDKDEYNNKDDDFIASSNQQSINNINNLDNLIQSIHIDLNKHHIIKHIDLLHNNNHHHHVMLQLSLQVQFLYSHQPDRSQLSRDGTVSGSESVALIQTLQRFNILQQQQQLQQQ